MSPVFFFLITFAILSCAYGYVGWRLIIPSNLSPVLNYFAWGVLILMLLLPYITFILRMNKYENSFSDIISWIGYVSLGLFSLVFAFVLAKDVLFLLVIIGNNVIAFISAPVDVKSVADPSRREFLFNTINVGILAGASALTGYGIFNVLKKPKVERITIPVKNLPAELNGLTIAQFSDLHVGPTVQRSFVQEVVNMVNELNADIIVFTGDLVDGSVDALSEHVEPVTQLKCKYGKYFITGNHEYYSGVLPWVNKASELGFDVLINENRKIEINGRSVLLAGVTDYSGGQFLSFHKSDPHKAIKANGNSELKILLAHQPRSVYEASKAGFDIQLSGHTHGGQYFPYTFMAHIGQPFIKGLHKFENMWVYVNRGTGYWGPPLRIGAPSEISLIKLVTS